MEPEVPLGERLQRAAGRLEHFSNLGEPDRDEAAGEIRGLAMECFALQAFPPAEQLLRLLLESQERAYGQKSPEVARSLNALARALEPQEKWGEAYQAYNRALAAWEAEERPDQSELAATLEGLGQLFYAAAQMRQAEAMARRSLGIRRSRGTQDMELASSCNLLARICTALYGPDHAEANELHAEALRILESELGLSQEPAGETGELEVLLVEPLVLRLAGLPFSHFTRVTTRDQLWCLLDEPRFLDCLATMHHRVFPSLRSRRKRVRPEKRPSDVRRAELTLYRYLTRFCSRNDTTGDAGTTVWGSLGDGSTHLCVDSPKRRVVWPSPRHAEALSHRAAYGVLRPRARLDLVARLVWNGTDLSDCDAGQSVSLSPEDRDLVDLVARTRPTFGELDEHQQQVAEKLLQRPLLVLHPDMGGRDVLEVLLELARGTELEADLAALQRLRKELVESHGLEFVHLMEQADAIAGRIVGYRLLDLDEAERQIEGLDLDAGTRRRADWLLLAARPRALPWISPVAAELELAGLLGRSQPTSAGRDRSFFICDSSPRGGSLVLGSALRQRIQEQLRGWFRLAAWQEYQRELTTRSALAEVPRREMSLARFTATVASVEQSQHQDHHSRDIAAMRQILLAADDARWTVEEGPSSELMIREHQCHPGFEAWLRDKRFVSTVDLMLGGTTAELEAGGGCLLMSEAHCGGDGLCETTLFARAHPRRSLAGHASALFGEMVVVQPSLVNKLNEAILLQLQDASLAVTNLEGWWPQQRTVPISSLRVRPVPGGWTLHDGTRDWRLITEELTFGNVRTVCYSPLSLVRWACAKSMMLPDGPIESYPELRLGELVLARRTARLEGSLAVELLRRGELQQALSMPRFTFVTGQGKPMLCDFTSSFALEVLEIELARSQSVSFSPMQPAPQELWLNSGEEVYTSELRMMVACDGPDFALSSSTCLLPCRT